MKRFGIFSAVSFFCLLALSPSGFGAAIGAHGGINSASLSTSTTVSGVTTSVSSASSTRLMLGAFYEGSLNPVMNLQLEANYASFVQGYALGTIDVPGLAYLSVPLFIKAKLSLGLPIKPFFMVGPDFMLKVSGSGTYKSMNLALDFGGGVEVSVAPLVSLVASARYSMGLTNILENSTTSETKTRALQILGGVAFGF